MIATIARGVYGPAGVALASPASGTQSNSVPPFVWGTAAKNVKQSIRVHFHIQVASDNLFTSIVVEAHTRISVTGFQYESSPGTWSAFPANGLAAADVGKNVRYTPTLSSLIAYYWRVRVEQFLD